MIDRKLIVSIIKLLKEETLSSEVNEETKESLEVAVQCLQTAYDLSNDTVYAPHLQVPLSLQDIFQDVCKNIPVAPQTFSEEALAQAEELKNTGNLLMKEEKISEALEAYTRAINLNSRNAVYYCNRAAAFSRLNSYASAINDCEKAISIDPNYSKAYGRMGLAYGSLNNLKKAIECYKKAVELDPTNESYKSNLKIAEEKIASSSNINPFDVTSLLNNPILRNMASSMIDNPNVINLMSGLMATSLNEEGEEREGIDALLHAGQRLAAQMHATNPALVEQLRQHFTSPDEPNSENRDPTSNP